MRVAAAVVVVLGVAPTGGMSATNPGEGPA
jgi:hypothetical protein